jgi:threonine synthase
MKTIQRPQPALAQSLGVPEVWFKREDLHPYGSHKGRAIPLMIKDHRKHRNVYHFVISSSGNAAVAAAINVAKYNENHADKPMTLRILVGKNIDPKKKQVLESYATDGSISIEEVERPKQTAFQMDKNGDAVYLRQSTDDIALRGYFDLAKELSKIPQLTAVFIPTSSGTTAQSVAEALAQMNISIQVHVVQTEFCHPIAVACGASSSSADSSVASAIVDNVAHRKEACAAAIAQTGGTGWIVSDREINDAISLATQHTDVTLSPNSALAVAGLKKALTLGWKCKGPVACLITGP